MSFSFGARTNSGPQVFISSTVHDLHDTRKVIAGALTLAGFDPVLSEEPGFPTRQGLTPYASCLKTLERACLVITIIGKRYGAEFDTGWGRSCGNTPRTPTFAEFMHAIKLNKRVFVYIHRDVMAHYTLWRQDRTAPMSIENLRALGYDNFQKTMHLVEKLKRPAKENNSIPWITPFSDSLDIINDLRGKLCGDLQSTWQKFESWESDWANQLLMDACEDRIRLNEEAFLQDIGNALRTRVGIDIKKAINKLEKLNNELCDVNNKIAANANGEHAKTPDSDKMLDKQSSLLRRINDAEHMIKARQRVFLLHVLGPTYADPRAKAKERAGLTRLWNEMFQKSAAAGLRQSATHTSK